MKFLNWTNRAVVVAVATAALVLAGSFPAGAATAPSLGTAQSFAVLGGTTVTNTGSTSIVGDLGVSPGSAITDNGTITLTGSVHAGDAVALQAQNDVITAYDALTAEPCTDSFSGTAVEIGGQTLVPGVYCYSSSAVLTGELTLDGDGVFIFKMESSLTTAANSTVALLNGALPCNVFWQIGSSADLFTNTTFVGDILALTSITLQTGTQLMGRALARNGAVTMDTNTISNASECVSSVLPTATFTATSSPSPTSTPTTASFTGPAATSTASPLASPSPVATSTVPGAPPASSIELGPSETPQATPPAPATPGVPDLPRAGSGPQAAGHSPWRLVLVAMIAVSGGLALRFSLRASRWRT